MKRLAAYIFLLLAAASCRNQDKTPYREIFAEHDSFCIVVGISEMIDFGKIPAQAEYNPFTHHFRVGAVLQGEDVNTGRTVETVQEYFVAVLDSNPLNVGDKCQGSVILRSAKYKPRSYKVSFETIRAENGMAWLWDDAIKMGVVVKTGPENS